MVTRRQFLASNGLIVAGTATGEIGGGVLSPILPAGAAPAGGIAWIPGRLLPRFAEPGHLHAASVAALPGEDQLLLTTLQGLVNRRRPELYFLYDRGEDTPDERWLAGFDADQVTLHADALSLVAAYRDRAKGAIVYDPAVPDSVNVATTLAGLENAVVATAEQAAQHGFRVIEDLRARFAGQDKVRIYRWQLEHLWSRCEQRLLAGLPPTRLVDVEGVSWREVARETEEIRDSSNRAMLTFDLSQELGGEAVYLRFTDAFTFDGWGASVGGVVATADGATIAEFIPGRPEEEPFLFSGNSPIGGDQNRFADGNNYFVYRFQPPAGTTSFTVTVDIWNQYLVTATDTAPQRHEPIAYFRDYVVATRAMVVWLDPNGAPGELLAEIFDRTAPTTPYLGWFSNDVAGEWGGVDLAATHAVEVFAADFYMNGTVHGGVRADIANRPPRPKPANLANKVYLTLTFGEGDNLQFCQRHLRELWDHPDRGQVPTNWTISPVLADAGPALYRYFQQTATANDLLVCGPSGAGYTYGGSWPGGSFAKYADVTERYLRRTGLDLVYAYNPRNANDDGWIPIDGKVLDIYRRRTSLRGIIQSWETGGILATGELPVIGNYSKPGNAAEYKQALDDHVGDWDGQSPFFIAAGINAWNWTPADIVALAGLLAADDRYRIVLADTFFDLLRRAPAPQPRPG